MTTLPKGADALEAMLPAQLDAGHKVIVPALIAIARLLADRVIPDAAATPAEIREAFSLLDAWSDAKADGEALWAASASLEEYLDRARAHKKRSFHDDFVVVLLGVLRKAMYEDHDDWPSEVVLPAVELLCRLGDEEPQAVQTIASVLQRHGLL